ncbi:RnfABCDGE type electron transport complex subunit D [Thiobacter aerophilum]|uniref:Ion-translocating oxidoreductase complex subunit D n=1 Tax=Thiobacter aerophilum TaxID=3121275 RepID=A0ABV0EEC1_9BURK
MTYVAQPASVGMIMGKVLLALGLGIAAYVIYFGPAILVSLTLASLAALACEALVLRLRGYVIAPFLKDGSALVTAWLLALSMPPLAPWWLVVAGTAFAIVVAKHLYGGLGNNLFNPAMAGYVLLLVSFPSHMTQWPAAEMLAHAHLSLLDAAIYIFTGHLPAGVTLDAITMATPLDMLKTQLKLGHTVNEVTRAPLYGYLGGRGSEVIAAAWLVGGLILLKQRVITWHVPVAMLAALFAAALWFHVYDPDRYVAPWFHLATGGAMLGAFFIATDPVTGPTTPMGKLIFGAAIGLLVYLIRTFGGYPDGVAFAVLIMNMAVPLIDLYTQPRVIGHDSKKSDRS